MLESEYKAKTNPYIVNLHAILHKCILHGKMCVLIHFHMSSQFLLKALI